MSRIIRVCEDTPRIAVRIVQGGCGGGQLYDWRGVKVRIEPWVCADEVCEPVGWVHAPCGSDYSTVCAVERERALEYPAFDTDAYGRVVFWFDDKLWGMPPGRYRASFWHSGVCLHAELPLELCGRRCVVDQVAVQSLPACVEVECL